MSKEQAKQIDNSPVNPVFIVGAPRSGTSLLRVLLNRHPAFGLCDETYFFYYVYHRQNIFGDLQNLQNRRVLIERYSETRRIRGLDVDLDALKQHLLEEATDYQNFFIALLKFFAQTKGKKRYGEKTPHHAFEAETLCRIYPQCRLIHLVRDPRDVVESLMRMPWGSPSIAANTRLWVKSVKAAELCKDEENFLRVKYEMLVNNPEVELRRICKFLSEPFDEQMLAAATEEKKGLHPWFQRAQKPVNTNRIEKWRDALTARQIAIVERIAGETMRTMGYSPTDAVLSSTRHTAALAHEAFAAVNSRIMKLPRIWYHWIQPKQLAAEEAWIDNVDSKSKRSDANFAG